MVLGPNNTFTAPPATPSYALYQLNGGTLTTTGIQQKDPNVTAIVNFNGGTLRAANSGTLINPITTAQIQAGGLTVDTDGNSPSITMALSGAGALTKTGTGTQTLSGASTYTNVRTVQFERLKTTAVLYPNPHQGSFTLDLQTLSTGTYQVDVLDLAGRRVYQTQLSGGQKHPLLPTLPQGSYIVRISGQTVNITLPMTRN